MAWVVIIRSVIPHNSSCPQKIISKLGKENEASDQGKSLISKRQFQFENHDALLFLFQLLYWIIDSYIFI